MPKAINSIRDYLREREYDPGLMPGMIVYYPSSSEYPYNDYYQLLRYSELFGWRGIALQQDSNGNPLRVVQDRNINTLVWIGPDCLIYEPALEKFYWVWSRVNNILVVDARTFDEGEG